MGSTRREWGSEAEKRRKSIKGPGYHSGQLGFSPTEECLGDCVEHTSKLPYKEQGSWHLYVPIG